MGRHSLFRAFAIAAMMMSAGSAFAAADEPVRKIMDLATALWSDTPPESGDYFDKDHIGLFSKEMIAAYRESEKYPLYEDGATPFGYDVITNSQEGCPLQDLTIAPATEAAGVSTVKVTFKPMTCFEEGSDKDAVMEVQFKVITEDGKPVISDIDRIVDGKPSSLLAEMRDIAKEGAAEPAQPEPETQQ